MKHSIAALLLLASLHTCTRGAAVSDETGLDGQHEGTQPGHKDLQAQTSQQDTTTTTAPRTAIIAEVVGLSALKGFALLTFPFLIPIVILIIALLIMPLPLLSAPLALGRRLGDWNEVDILAELLQSSNCMERFSCEMGRNIKSPQVRAIVDQSFAELVGQLEGKWINSYYSYVIGSNYKSSPTNMCVKFKCKVSKNPM